MSNLIDNVFDYETIRYVPVIIQNEWKNLYNLYKGNFFDRQNKIYNIYCSIKNDYKNDEINKINYLLSLINKYSYEVQNLQPKLSNDIDYAERVKKKLLVSISKIYKFLKYKEKIFNQKNYKKSIKNSKVIEKFLNKGKKVKLKEKNILIVLVFIVFTYIILNKNI